MRNSLGGASGIAKELLNTRSSNAIIELACGIRVVTGTGSTIKKGEIKFIGETQFASGEWIGIVLDGPDGKNDGSVGDVTYFTCEPLHGLFVKRAQVKIDKEYYNSSDSANTTNTTAATDRSARLARRTASSSNSDTNVTVEPPSTSIVADIPSTKVIDESVSDVPPLVKSTPTKPKSPVTNSSITHTDLEQKIKELSIALNESKKEIQQLKQNHLTPPNHSLTHTPHPPASTTLDTARHEAIVAQLNETIELITLDKEQIAMDLELAEEKIQILQRNNNGGVSVQTDYNDSKLSEENAKLRDALKKLNDLSQSERQRLQQYQVDFNEFNDLKLYKESASISIEELQTQVDNAVHYESMIEILSEKCNTLNNKNEQLQNTISELEQTLDIQEQLDSTQRVEINELRSQLDQVHVHTIPNLESTIKGLTGQITQFQNVINNFKSENSTLKEQLHIMESKFSQSTDELVVAIDKNNQLGKYKLMYEELVCSASEKPVQVVMPVNAPDTSALQEVYLNQITGLEEEITRLKDENIKLNHGIQQKTREVTASLQVKEDLEALLSRRDALGPSNGDSTGGKQVVIELKQEIQVLTEAISVLQNKNLLLEKQKVAKPSAALSGGSDRNTGRGLGKEDAEYDSVTPVVTALKQSKSHWQKLATHIFTRSLVPLPAATAGGTTTDEAVYTSKVYHDIRNARAKVKVVDLSSENINTIIQRNNYNERGNGTDYYWKLLAQ